MAEQESILVVDDKPDNLRLLSNILTGEGYKVRKVLNGRLAIDAAQLDPPDLILLDIMMPEPDGYEVCQHLKTNRQTRDIPIIFLSALDTVVDKVKAFMAGGVDYITKPFQQEEVLARVKIHLEIRRLHQTLQAQNVRLQQEVEQRQHIEAELKAALKELRETQEQIIVKEKLASLGALMAGIAHELRNPLNFVNNYAEGSKELIAEILTELETATNHLPADLLESLRELLAEVRDNATAIHQHGQRAERIIQSMMQHTRNAQDDQQLIDLNQLIEEATDLAYHNRRAQTSNFNVTIYTNYDMAVGSIEGSPDLSRAFINLIDNACYAVYKKQQRLGEAFDPSLWITTRKLPNHIEVRIRDNGIGMEPEVQKQIFDPFFTTKANEGTGLGLSIAYEIIVEQHHGTLAVNSQLSDFTEFLAKIPV